MTLCINPRCDRPQNSDNAQFCQNCQSELLLNQRYRAVKVLGVGGFGKTYEASDLGTPNKVIKVLIDNSPKAIELFQREAEVLSQLNYPGIPKVEPNSYIILHPANSQEPVHCFVMEKVEGMNLRDYLKKSGQPINSETAERWLRELVLILQKVHEKGILHRDIKPQNIIFKPDGKLALIDFGAVKEGTGTEVATEASNSGGKTEVSTHAKGVGTSISSTGYTPIEQINGQTVKQSDLFALGRTFVFLLTGLEPTDKSIYNALDDELSWQKYARNVSPHLADLLNHMMARLPKDRPANTQEILQELERIPVSPEPRIKEREKRQENVDTGTVIDDNRIRRDRSPEAKNTWGKRIGIGLAAGALSFTIRALYAAFISSSPTPPPPPVCLVSQGANVRATPNGEVLTQVSSGTSLTPTGLKDGQWLEISAPVAGWIHNSRIVDTCSSNSGL
jgi:serine/threonine protein kinase